MPFTSGAPAEDLRELVLTVVGEVTRYPRDILLPEANLEEDLGIDSVKRAEIFAVLKGRFNLPDTTEAAPIEVRTVGDVIAAVEHYLGSAATQLPESVSMAPTSAPIAEPAPSAVVPPRPQRLSAPTVAAKPFVGRVALVTGSGHGLGKTIACHLARLGATVVVNSFHSRDKGDACAEEIVAEGGRAVHLWGSVANPGQLESLFAEIGSRFGGLDFFISNASNGVFARLADVRPEDWDKAFRTNVVALHQASLLAADLMRKQGGGKIVALSANASQRYVDYFGCMGPVKAAVECLVRYLAVELGADNIQVNAVAAGPVLGELLDKYPEFDRLRSKWEATVPRRQLNTEQEIAEAVTFLLTASGMNGSVLLVDAGGSQRITAGPR
jgi:NAD(P)-dependent dehydrogenase (short-subunit alcohol dehydrogenase family)/acyl carrier protein